MWPLKEIVCPPPSLIPGIWETGKSCESGTSCLNNTGQQRFCPMRKNVSDVFLDIEFKYVSRISLLPTPFALH